jgi:two-component system, OmpR family, sensor kinase
VTLSIRARLTIWYTIVLCGVLVASGYALLVAQARVSLLRLDAELARICRAVGSVMSAELDERRDQDVTAAAMDTRDGLAVPGWTVAIASESGEVLAGTWTLLPRAELRNADIGPWHADGGQARTITASVGQCRVWRESMEHDGARFTVFVAAPLAPLARERAALREAAAILLPLAVIIGALGGWWIGRRALVPLTSMAMQATGISDRTPNARLSIGNCRDELGQLGGAFNALLDRLAHALQAQRQFMADASHQLRTPVSVIRTAAQVTLARSGRAEADYRESLAIVAEQSARLTRMVDDMFLLARADADGRPLERADFYFDELIDECARAVRVVADQRQLRVEVAGPADVLFRGDEALLRQMLTNLLDNAVSHTPSGGRVSIALRVESGAILLDVADTGSGIPAADRARIFERFVRLVPTKRSGVPHPGAGLGLPIARWIAEAHGGTLTLDETTEAGSRFVVRLPFAREREPVSNAGTVVSAGAATPASSATTASPATTANSATTASAATTASLNETPATPPPISSARAAFHRYGARETERYPR